MNWKCKIFGHKDTLDCLEQEEIESGKYISKQYCSRCGKLIWEKEGLWATMPI